MDLISRKAAIEACIEISKQEEEHSRMWAAGLRYAKRILTKLPSAPAVPMDMLCEWLANIAGGKNNTLCTECYGSKGAECPGENRLCENPDAWKRHLTKWMEGLDAKTD